MRRCTAVRGHQVVARRVEDTFTASPGGRFSGMWWLRQTAGVWLVALATGVLRATGASPADVALTYLPVVLLASTVGGLWSGAGVAVLAMLAFNYFFLPPVGTLTIANPNNWFALVAFMTTAIVSGQLVARTRAHDQRMVAQEQQARRLLELSRRILTSVPRPTELDATLGALAQYCGQALLARRALIRTWVSGRPEGWHPEADWPRWPQATLDTVDQAMRQALPRRPLCLPVAGQGAVLALPLGRHGPRSAVLVVDGGPAPESDLVKGVAGLGSLALDRFHLLGQLAEAEALRQSDNLKSALLSSVSHELRTPLATIRVAATALQRPDGFADARIRDDLLRAIDEESERLNHLIANLLCMSRIEAGPLVLERRLCEVDELVWEGVRLAGRRLDPARLCIAVPEGLPAIHCDLGLAGIALANLLDNAAKYGPAGSPIGVGVRTSPDRRVVALWIDDKGPGVPAGDAERIFQRFQRGQPSLARPAGTGLGLPIARALVEAHGGRMWVEAGPDGGSRFTTTWPSGEEGQPSAADEP